MSASAPSHFDLYLGLDHWLTFFGWHPDEALNPQYRIEGEPYPSVERAGAIVHHLRADGVLCASGLNFDVYPFNRFVTSGHLWKVESWEPLTISPSLLCAAAVLKDGSVCNDHGFIRGALWVPA